MRFKTWLLEEKMDDTIQKALGLDNPNDLNIYSDDKYDEIISMLNYAIVLQKKEVILSNEDKQQIAILQDLENKLGKWESYREEKEKEKKKDSKSDNPFANLGTETEKLSGDEKEE